MEETLKVNIGGVAFVINKDACEILRKYLNELSAHYGNTQEGIEVMKDIESRIAELLLEKQDKQDVIAVETVNSIIAVMGTPSDIEDGDIDNGSDEKKERKDSPKSSEEKIRKNFYRDRENRKLGGVCAGLGSYFNIDATILRFFFVVLILLSVFIDSKNFFLLAIGLYAILWICMPAAKTYVQRCAMKGVDPGVKGAEKISERERPVRGSAFGRVIRFIFGGLFVLTGLFLLAVLWIINTGVVSGLGIYSFLGLLNLPGFQPFLFSFLVILVWLIPCLIFIYLGVRWMFAIKRPKYRPGLIAALVWIAAVIALSVWGAHIAVNSASRVVAYETDCELPKPYDTLYVEYTPLPAEYNGEKLEWEEFTVPYKSYNVTSDNGVDYYELDKPDTIVFDKNHVYSKYKHWSLYSAKRGKKRNIFAFYPSLRVNRSYIGPDAGADSSMAARPVGQKAKVSIDDVCLLRSRWRGKIKKGKNCVEVKDSLIMIHPKIISSTEKFNGSYQMTDLSVPENSVVIINKQMN